MRKLFGASAVVTAAVIAAVCLASPVHALEKRLVRVDDGLDDWSAAATCLVSYYNFCTGWVWVLGFDDPELIEGNVQVGVNATAGPHGWSLVQSRIRYWSGSPNGRGYTGTISTYAADVNGCPVGAPIESQPFLPPDVSGGNAFYTQDWDGSLPLPSSFVIAATFPVDDIIGGINPLGLATDYGTIGPTGPDACGSCFPTGRQSHSYVWLDGESSYCPGRTLVPQDCEVELLWDLSLSCTVSVEDSNWGAIKGFYR